MSKRIPAIILIVAIISLALCACAPKSVVVDYADDKAFEAALNAGENLEGKTLIFDALELHPQSTLGYNVWAGEHLNFISSRNPDIKVGDKVAVRATKIESVLGSWNIAYEKINGVVGDTSIRYEAPTIEVAEDTAGAVEEDTSSIEDTEASTTIEVENTPTAEPLKIVDYGWYFDKPHDDTLYVDFVAKINNPNKSLIARYPKVIVTVKNGDGSILATEDQVGGSVQPEDTITMCGMFSMNTSDLTDDAQIYFGIEWNEFVSDYTYASEARTTDFKITNVSEKNGKYDHYITGEITNNFSEDVDMAYVSLILRKNKKIVFMENTFVDNLHAGQTKAFEFQRFSDWPDHDKIEVSAMPW